MKGSESLNKSREGGSKGEGTGAGGLKPRAQRTRGILQHPVTEVGQRELIPFPALLISF